MTEVQDSPFLSSGSVSYPSGDNAVDASKTAIISSGGRTQTLTFNAAGQLLNASQITGG